MVNAKVIQNNDPITRNHDTAILQAEVFGRSFENVCTRAAIILADKGLSVATDHGLFLAHIDLHRRVSIQFVELMNCPGDDYSLMQYLYKVAAQGYGLGVLADNSDSKSTSHHTELEKSINSLRIIKELLIDVSPEELALYNQLHDIGKLHTYPRHEEYSAWVFHQLSAVSELGIDRKMSQNSKDILEAVIFHHVLFGLLWIDGNWATMNNILSPAPLSGLPQYHQRMSRLVKKMLSDDTLKTVFFRKLALYTLLDIAAADGKRGYLNNLRVTNITDLIKTLKDSSFSNIGEFLENRKQLFGMKDFFNHIANASLMFVKGSDLASVQELARSRLEEEIRIGDYPAAVLDKSRLGCIYTIKRDYVHSIYVLLGTGCSESQDLFTDYGSYLKLNLMLGLGCKKGSISYISYRNGKDLSALSGPIVLRSEINEFWKQVVLLKGDSENLSDKVRSFLACRFLITYKDMVII